MTITFFMTSRSGHLRPFNSLALPFTEKPNMNYKNCVGRYIKFDFGRVYPNL